MLKWIIYLTEEKVQIIKGYYGGHPLRVAINLFIAEYENPSLMTSHLHLPL